MIQAFLDPNTYTFVGSFTVQSKKDLIIPKSLILSQTMLVKWQIRNLAKGATIDQIPPAILSSSLEIAGLGILEGDDYQIVPSIQGRDRVQLITLDPSLPHKLVLNQVSDLVTNSVLEIYTSNLSMAQFNNPAQVNTDLSPMIDAIERAAETQISAAAEIAAAPEKKVIRLTDGQYSPSSWSNSAEKHVAIFPDTDRGSVSIFNPTNEPIAVDLFLDIASKGGTPQHNGILQPGGTYTLSDNEAFYGVLLYTLNGSKPGAVSIDLGYYSAVPVVEA